MDFTPKQKYTLLSKMGYTGSMDSPEMDAFIQSNPAVAARMGKFDRALKRGFQEGGMLSREDAPSSTEIVTKAVKTPEELVTKPTVAGIKTTPEQFLKEGVGQVTQPAPKATTATAGPATQAEMPEKFQAAQMQAARVSPQVQAQTQQLQAAQGQVSPEAQVQAAQQDQSAVSQLESAQGAAILMDNPVTREIQQGELVSGTTVDAAKVEQLNESIQAATATPSQKATVQGQLESLMQDFEGGETPVWAAGAIRNANAIMAQRGLGASSMAGQAVLQAAMESALPIAQADAQTRAQFEAQNLSNRQQAAMFAAEQRARFLGLEFDQEFQARVQNASRVADVANMNFTAEQQIALENSRVANTVNLENLRNDQAMVMAEASALANLDITNLNNRQQAAVQNAQNFLQMDLTNLSNEQQTAIFKSQQNINALLSDQAAENAAEQFNAASENQVNQFFADLQSSISRFNADQKNAIAQFNAGEKNATERFNAQIKSARDQFNAQNSLVVAQANAKWRQDIATLETAAQNEANLEAAKTANAMTATGMDEVFQKERDIMAYAFSSTESALDRELEVLLADKREDLAKWTAEQEEDAAKGYLTTRLGYDLLFGGSGDDGILG